MFDILDDSPQSAEPHDWTGLYIVALAAIVFAIFAYLSKLHMGFTLTLALVFLLLALKLRWDLHRRLWFWPTVAFVFVLQAPLIFIVQWPNTLVLITHPLAIAEFFFVYGALGLADRVFLKNSSHLTDEKRRSDEHTLNSRQKYS
jgi:hypothetical protein